MTGCIIASVVFGLFVLFAIIGRRRCRARGWHAPRGRCFGGRGWRGPGWRGPEGHGRGGSLLGWLQRRVGTRPEQEPELEAALNDLWAEVTDELRDELRRSRQDLGQIMREDEFDAAQMGDLFARHDETFGRVRRALVGALARIHDVLDPTQRGRLAELLRSAEGPWMGGPYRSRA